VSVVEEIVNGTDQYMFPLRQMVDEHIVLMDTRPFNKSWLINVALKKSPYVDNIIIDTDMLFAEDFFQKIVDFKEDRNLPIFSCYNHISALPGKDNPVLRQAKFEAMVAMGGVWYADRGIFFTKVGGMNELYFGYGAEDNDAWYRANYTIGKVHTMSYHLIHQYHDWAFPSPVRMSILETTKKHLPEVIQRLKAANLGNPAHPTLIDIGDIKETSTCT